MREREEVDEQLCAVRLLATVAAELGERPLLGSAAVGRRDWRDLRPCTYMPTAGEYVGPELVSKRLRGRAV